MQTTSRKSGLNVAGDGVLAYAALFSLCALLSYLGDGTLAALVFFPAALLMATVGRYRAERFPSSNCTAQP